MGNISDFTEEEFIEARENLKLILMGEVPSVEKPFAVLTGGQPGAGKTTIARIYEDLTYGDIVFINGDDFRKRHPRFLKIYNEHGGDFVSYTSEFSGRMVQEMIDYAREKRLNMVVEGTLRTTSVPNSTRSFLQESGYKVNLAVMVVRPEISYLSTLKRYNQMLERGTFGRLTSKSDHDFVVNSIVENLDKIYSENKFDDILLFNRNKDCLYRFSECKDVNPSVLMHEEFSRELNQQEKDDILRFYSNYVDRKDIEFVLNGGFSFNVKINALGTSSSEMKFFTGLSDDGIPVELDLNAPFREKAERKKKLEEAKQKGKTGDKPVDLGDNSGPGGGR